MNRAVALTFTCVLSVACSDATDGTKKEGDVCDKMEDCEGDLICSEGRCALPCNRDDVCGRGRFCSDGLCADADCGNGSREGAEQCDAGQQNADSGACTTECKLNVCGDENVHAGVEECDEGPRNSDIDADACRTTCKLAHCGDGVKDTGETCDDGYTDTCGSCNADCTHTGSGPGLCGDGVRCPEAEACDDGYTDACGSCNADCSGAGSPSVCGDGVRCPEFEDCDDGNTVDDVNGCDGDCKRYAVCGNGVREAWFEECDDGDTLADGNGCGPDCSRSDACGNNDTESWFEACEDGNTSPGDGCTAWCTPDTGCGDDSCNSTGPRFPVTGAPQLSVTGGTEPVVADAKTGLMWQGCAAGLLGPGCSGGDVTTMVWEDAVSYCFGLSWNSFSDWYLPDEYELQSIVDYSVHSPAIGTGAFPATPSDGFWTSSSSNLAWYVDFGDGEVGAGSKSSSRHARCVRRGP